MTVGTQDEMVMVERTGAAGAAGEVATPELPVAAAGALETAGAVALLEAGLTYDGVKVVAGVAGTAGTAGAELFTRGTLGALLGTTTPAALVLATTG